jgi:hypothetical protein
LQNAFQLFLLCERLREAVVRSSVTKRKTAKTGRSLSAIP